MKNKTKLKKASNKVEQPFLTRAITQPTDSKAVYQGSSESQTVDSGRSMVEMLGVLAVVGVLSVGGILGYKYAMNKYQANQIVNELNLTSSQMAIMLMRPHTADFELSLGEPYDDGHIATNALAFDFGCGTGAAGEDTNCAADDIEYFSEVQNLPKEVCQNLVQLAQSLPYLEEVLVNNVADTTGVSCADNSTVRCLFNADQNALIDDNPDPEVTDTAGDGCGVHAYSDEYGTCWCEEGWYNPVDGHYFETDTGQCTLSQAEADKNLCNDNGTWDGDYQQCNCNDGTQDRSNNNCHDNGGCCKDTETTTTETTTKVGTTTTPTTTTGKASTTTITTTPEITMTPEVSVSGDSRCGEHAWWDEYWGRGSCHCEEGWFFPEGGLYYGTNCSLSQAEANKNLCNDKGRYNGYGCNCNNGVEDTSNDRCKTGDGCCQDISLCTSNSDCKSGEYCYVNAYNCSQEFGGSRTSGGCRTSSGTTKEISGLGSVTRGTSMTWWSAQRYCQSLGKQMVSFADLGCTTTTGTARCKDSQIVKDLYNAFGYSYIWTSDQKGDNCNAYIVYLSNGSVSTTGRNSNTPYALCK